MSQYGQYVLEKITTLLPLMVFFTNSATGPDISASARELLELNAPIEYYFARGTKYSGSDNVMWEKLREVLGG